MKEQWHMKVIVREFVPMHLELELRAFVFQKKMTAISQYYCDLYVPLLVKHKKKVEESVKKFFYEKVVDKIKLEDYVIDFVVDKEGKDSWSVLIVELNPFSRTTGSCLFDWEKDKQLIHSQNGSFEFRVCGKDVCKKAKHLIMPWEHLITKALEQVK